uniref:(northern house mosquito) hypothetical protein n=1 Tax=Culex pipiens TaxID=7175 RepID=A0A8D8ALD5_CULPI
MPDFSSVSQNKDLPFSVPDIDRFCQIFHRLLILNKFFIKINVFYLKSNKNKTCFSKRRQHFCGHKISFPSEFYKFLNQFISSLTYTIQNSYVFVCQIFPDFSSTLC